MEKTSQLLILYPAYFLMHSECATTAILLYFWAQNSSTFFCSLQSGRTLYFSVSSCYKSFLLWNQFSFIIFIHSSVATSLLSRPVKPSNVFKMFFLSCQELKVLTNQAYLSVILSKLNEGYISIDYITFDPMSLEDYMISLKDGSTIIDGLEGWFSKIMAQVCNALLMGETNTMSTSRFLTISLAFSACWIPLSVIQTSKYLGLNFSAKYSSESRQVFPYFSSHYSATLLN